MNKIKISFEVTDNYNREDFREFLQLLLQNDDVDVYIISESTYEDYVDNIADTLGIDNSKVVSCESIDDKITAIDDNSIDIHFDNYQRNVLDILSQTECEAILVNQERDSDFNLFYMVQFDRILKDIIENS